jgi:hypothetical protein
MRIIAHLPLFAAACLILPVVANADTITNGSTTVDANAVIYAAGSQSSIAASAGGSVPNFISIGGTTYLTFSTTGTITINGGTQNDADGAGAATPTSSETGYGSLSGMTADGGGYLVGVFLAAGGPTGSAPASLDYTSGSPTTGDSSYSPLLDQVFFIGDGLTGDGSGSAQTFYVPAGATELYFGISDAGGYHGGPGSYGDNSGTFALSYSDVTVGTAPPPPPGTTPEPSSLVLLGTSLLSAAGVLRKKLTRK